MNEFNKLEHNLHGRDPYLEQALAAPDTEASQTAFDAFANQEKQAELLFLPSGIPKTNPMLQTGKDLPANVVPLRLRR